MSSNVWVSRFQPCPSFEEIRRRVTRPAKPIRNLKTLPPEAARLVLENALREVYIPSDQCCELLQRFWEMALGHALANYPGADAFLDACSDVDRKTTSSVVCLTGLAGVGKSDLINALRRLFPEDSSVSVSRDYSDFPLQAMWSYTFSDTSSIKQVLSRRAAPGCTGYVLQSSRQRAYLAGVCIQSADEFQFVATSDNASTRISAYILALASLGPLLIYVCNYSLAHKLMLRKHEEQDRLLANPVVMHPDAPDDPYMIQRLDEYRRIDPQLFRFDPERDAMRFNVKSFGLGRLIRDLICIAFAQARKSGGVVDMDAIDKAYASTAFSVSQKNVEYLKATAMGLRPTGRQRPDLECPFSLPANAMVKQAMAAKAEYEARMATEKRRSLQTAAERKAEWKSPGLKSQPDRSRSVRTSSRQPRTSSSPQSLIENFKKFGRK